MIPLIVAFHEINGLKCNHYIICNDCLWHEYCLIQIDNES